MKLRQVCVWIPFAGAVVVAVLGFSAWGLTMLGVVGGICGLPFLLDWNRAIDRWMRRRAGRCEICGYDLTGNVSGVCPECGERI